MADASSRTDTSTVLDTDDKNQMVTSLFSVTLFMLLVIDHLCKLGTKTKTT